MKVQLIAETAINIPELADLGYQTHDFDEESADELHEFAGRNCYRSFSRPNPATRENVDYLGHILEVGHESVLEHGSATFYIEASRSVLAELSRHRHLSFSVVSQRYVDSTELGIEIPPAFTELSGEEADKAKEVLLDVQEFTNQAYEYLVDIFEDANFPRKRAREAARAVMPNMTSSPMVVTANHRTWRYVIKNRWSLAADAEIRELAGLLLAELREIAPNTYQDIPTTPYGS